eukprot:CAMPEP_0172823498 /NCGR_PEP_ID=MMETSP1075-20121228/17375_1 /TAXON_ID=2916 /ORGANISM="Ceratium fusus, Strain PA161109" /LENGTH=45 /DNA_ID= /DNA_START= /DNA_END= /DNA_ORIENTATION=
MISSCSERELASSSLFLTAPRTRRTSSSPGQDGVEVTLCGGTACG